MTYENLERKLMEMLLAGNNDVLIRLREQYKSSKVISREHSDVGFFTTFLQQDRNDLCIDGKSFQIGDVDGSVNGIDGAVGFVLYIKNGFISMLEGYTNAIDKWPEVDDEIVLTYDSGNERDVERLKRKWA
ncbi:hypothetical protein [Tepidibacillus sp. HK-1]|uniref:hypothetical protein n=1 Tax=Tepidibacillus sp. HK-1 TaxID=1883407 RepID=UPI0008531CDD|nr:hypothetical protein [Tepidibacillus sp. HK-1]GBF10506.1 hypothetical protein HK1_00518 [Tepidibacillus sp. HK-1]